MRKGEAERRAKGWEPPKVPSCHDCHQPSPVCAKALDHKKACVKAKRSKTKAVVKPNGKVATATPPPPPQGTPPTPPEKRPPLEGWPAGGTPIEW